MKKIPKKIHQIWAGPNKIPELQSLYMKTCQLDGWEYYIWGDEDMTESNFPITFPYFQKIVDAGKQIGHIKYAQLADLMRLEILYQHGGVYIDTTAECLKDLEDVLKEKTFVVSNEDPCGFNCRGSKNKTYISNSFIASTKKNPIIKKILSKRNLNRMDFYDPRVNIVTGPYFLGEQLNLLKNDYDITILPMELIYPHGYKTPYKKASPDKCFSARKTKKANLEVDYRGTVYLEYPCKKYPNSYIIKHWNVGGTWKTKKSKNKKSLKKSPKKITRKSRK